MANSMSVPLPPQRQRSRWWIPLVIIVAVLGGMVLGIALLIGLIIFGIASAGSFSVDGNETPSVREHSILVLNLSSGVREYQYAPPLSGVSRPSMLDAITAIRYAASDNKVDGIVLRNARGLGMAQASELRRELLQFKKSGKWIYAFLDGGNEADYYIASVADSIFLAPLAMVEFNGFGGAIPFFKNISDKLGITWTVIQREEYKSAGEQFSRTRFSEPARQEILDVLNQRYRLFVEAVANARQIPQSTVERLLFAGVYRSEDFLRNKLADALMTDIQFEDFLCRKTFGNDTTKKLRTLRPSAYARYARAQTSSSLDESHTIAIVSAVGTIRTGKSSGEGEEIASVSLCKDIRKAANDSTVKAIIIRIESPGGSAQASEEIWHEIQRARTKKPVYASMSNVAASGGYYIASACDTIIAASETITGSIGVIAAIPNFSRTMNSIGVTFDTVTTSPNATFMNPLLPARTSDRQIVESMIDSIYVRFLERVAAGRKRTVSDIRTVAHGRVWTGDVAAQHGLVDVVCGLADAIEIAKRRIGVVPNKRPRLKFFPEQKDLSEAIVQMIRRFTGEEDDNESNAIIGAQTQTVISRILNPSQQRQVRQMLDLVRLSRREAVLMLLPVEVPHH
ncbi:MAG: signal peptide peptidase SppA [Chlorobi bacterium]|nr:signal peptide peptidase SppA [Chlorobiota bacterium]